MSVNETKEIVDDIKLRLSSPFLFTYMWVLLSFNINHVLFLFLEPLKISTKLDLLSSKWVFLDPVVVSILVIIFVPPLNNLAELFKQFWDLKLKQVSLYFKLKQYYTAKEYQDLENKYQQLENRYRATRSDFEDAQKQLEGSSTKSTGILAERPLVESSQPSNISTNDIPIAKPEKELNIKELMERTSFSNDEELIINKMAESSDAKLMYVNSKSGSTYSVDGKNIFSGIDSPLGVLKVKSAFENLISKGYIKPESDSIYALTTKGFEMVDKLAVK